jgi:hypothetical protein
LYVLATRTLLGVALGIAIAIIEREFGWIPFVNWDDGAGIGLPVGLIWGLLAWNGLPEPMYTKPGINPRAFHLENDKLNVDLADGRTITVPLTWYPRLLSSSTNERQNWHLVGDGHAVEWPDLDEHIGIEGLLQGRRSDERQESFQRWLAARDSRTGHLSSLSNTQSESIRDLGK